MKPSLTDKLLKRFGHQYILLMMIVTRLGGSIGGALVVSYVEFTLRMPEVIRRHFEVIALVVVVQCVSATVLFALYELRHVRAVLRRIKEGIPLDPDETREAGREAVTFTGRHHILEAWYTPLTCLVPVLIYLRVWDHADAPVLFNITWTVFMGITMALMATFFAVEHCMQGVIRYLFDHGVSIDYRSLPQGNLRFRVMLCSMLIIATATLMIGTLARQRADEIIDDPGNRDAAMRELKAHSVYITVAAVLTGISYASLMAGSVTKRVNFLLAAMERVGSGDLAERLHPTGNDEIDILARQFNTMVERLDQGSRTILDLNLNLEERVRDRTKQLDAARVEAETANRIKSEFLANISHELRTPLNGVIGMTGLLLATPLNSQQRKYAQTTKFSGTTLLELLNEVLDYSKIEAGRLEIEQIAFDLHDTFEPVLELMAHRCREKSIEIAYIVDPTVPRRLVGDPARLRQIISNLVNNAIKFTEHGSVIVRVGVENRLDRTTTLRIAVADTGIGIPESRYGRLFRPFSQVDASTTRKYGGTGLGLVISKKLCELMGGHMGFESQVGKGSTFWLTVPFQFEEQSPTASRPSSADELREFRILLVDANETSRAIVQEQLVNWGLGVHVVISGREAIDELLEGARAQSPYAIAIWDAGVSDVSTEEFAATVRSSPELAATVLMLLSPLATIQDPERLRSLGFADCLTKPLMQSSLYDALAGAVSRDGAGMPLFRLGQKAMPQPDLIPRTAREGVRILLAEDNEINQQVASEVLRLAGYACDVVGDGRQAVDRIKTVEYDVVLMDCQMPEMDGLAATRLIRRRERESSTARRSPLPIIALTANALNGEQERCRAAGMSDYLSKPFDPQKLVQTIEMHLAMNDQPAAGRTSRPTDLIRTIETYLEMIDPPAANFPQSEPMEPSPHSTTGQASGHAGPVQSEEVLDVEALMKRCVGKAELAEKLVGKLQARLEEDLREIAAAAAEGDCGRLASLAHRLKGAAANLAAEPIRRVAAEIEALGRSADLAGALTCLARLEHEGKRFRQSALPLSNRSITQPGPADPTVDHSRETVHASSDC